MLQASAFPALTSFICTQTPLTTLSLASPVPTCFIVVLQWVAPYILLIYFILYLTLLEWRLEEIIHLFVFTMFL